MTDTMSHEPTARALARLAHDLHIQPSTLNQITDALAAPYRAWLSADRLDTVAADLWLLLREAIATTLKHPEYASALLDEDEAAMYTPGGLTDALTVHGDAWPQQYPVSRDDSQPPWP